MRLSAGCLRRYRRSIRRTPSFCRLVGSEVCAEEQADARNEFFQNKSIGIVMRAEGIALDEGFRALHAGRSSSRWRAAGPLPEADRAHRGCLVLHHPLLLEDDGVEQLAFALRRIRTFADRLR